MSTIAEPDKINAFPKVVIDEILHLIIPPTLNTVVFDAPTISIMSTKRFVPDAEENAVSSPTL